MTRIKFDSEMCWEEYLAFYKPSFIKLGAVEDWTFYHRMRWEYFQKLRPFKDSVVAYRKIHPANNPFRFDHNKK